MIVMRFRRFLYAFLCLLPLAAGLSPAAAQQDGGRKRPQEASVPCLEGVKRQDPGTL